MYKNAVRKGVNGTKAQPPGANPASHLRIAGGLRKMEGIPGAKTPP